MNTLVRHPLFQTSLYALSVLLMRGISFFMLPFVTHLVTPEAFGLLELITTIATVLSVILSMGLEHALYRFCGSAKNTEQYKEIASHIFSLSILFTVLYLLLTPFFVHISSVYWPDLKYLLLLLLLTLALELMISVPLGWLRMNNKSFTFCFVSITRAIFQAGLVVLFLNNGHGIAGVLEAGLLSAAVSVVLLFGFTKKTWKFCLPDHSAMAFLKYGLPIVGSGLLAFILSGYDRWLIADFGNLQEVALYAIAAKFALLVTLGMQPFGMWFMPKRFTLLHGSNGLKKSQAYAHFGLQACLLVTLGVGVLAPMFIRTFLPDSYLPAIELIPFCVLWACFKEMTEFVNLGCLVGERTNIQLYINLFITLVGVLLMYWCGGYFGTGGILIGLVIAQALRFFIFHFLGTKEIDLKLPVLRITLLLTSIIVMVHWQTKTEDLWSSVISFIVMLGVYFAVHMALFYSIWKSAFLKLYTLRVGVCVG